MTLQEAYNKLVDRIDYVNGELSNYNNLKTGEEKAYLIGLMHQHVMEAAQVIADFKKQLPPTNQDCVGVSNPSSDTPIASEPESNSIEGEIKTTWTIEKFFEETRKIQKSDDIVLDRDNIAILCELIKKNYIYLHKFEHQINFYEFFTYQANRIGETTVKMYDQLKIIKHFDKHYKHV
jgi:hypothetical protein